MADWFYEDAEQEHGPYSPTEMRDLVAEGRINDSTRVRREDGEWYPAANIPGLIEPPADFSASAGDSTGGFIPYKNAPALIAYYMAVFSLIPCFGIPLGIAAVVLGIIGLKKRKETPEIKGTAHAWVGIILGGLMVIVWIGAAIAGYVAIESQD